MMGTGGRSFLVLGLLFSTSIACLADVPQITTYQYWHTRVGTEVRSCAYCTIQQGTFRGRVGPSVPNKPGTPLISANSDEPFEMEGALWILVFRPYNVGKPLLGYSLRPEDALIAPKNQLAFGVSVQPNQPESPTALPFWSLTGGGSIGLVVGFGLILTGLFWFVVRRRRPASVVYASRNTGGHNGADAHGDALPSSLFKTVLILGGLFVLSPLLMVALTMFWQSGGRPLPTQPAIWMLTSSAMLTLLVVAVIVGSIPIVFFAHDKWKMFRRCLFILLLAIILKLVVPDISQVFDPPRSGTRHEFKCLVGIHCAGENSFVVSAVFWT